MATIESIRKKVEEHEEALRKNPLLKKGLGSLLLEKDRLFAEDSNVVKLRNEVPLDSLEKYEKYQAIIK